jgi:hypothetical protein
MDLSAGSTDQYWFRCWKVNVKAVTGGIIELSGKALNQDVVIMSGGNLQSKITYLTNLNKRFCGKCRNTC